MGMHHAPNATAAGFLSDTSRSGSSTPTTCAINESPRTASGSGGRGGRRKNVSANALSGTGRGQKRKKDQRTSQSQPQQSLMMNQGGQIPSLGLQSGSMGILGVTHGNGNSN